MLLKTLFRSALANPRTLKAWPLAVNNVAMTRTVLYSTAGQEKKEKSVKEAVDMLTDMFAEKGVSEPRQSASLLVAHAVGHKTLHTVRRRSRALPAGALERLLSLAERRLARQPLQYLLGEWEFRDLTLDMRPPVFIPRPETEELVEHVLADPAVLRAATAVEVGPGTGAISLSLLKHMPQLRCLAIEASKTAYGLTLQNARKLGLSDRLWLYHSSLDADVGRMCELLPPRVDVIVSNPPYIPTRDMADLPPEVARYEDPLALEGGADGLSVVHHILALAQRCLAPQGSVWLEVDSTHPPLLKEIAPEYDLQLVAAINDFNNIPRFCHFKRGTL